jgi:transposase
MAKLNNKRVRWIVRHIANVGDLSMKDAADIYEISVRRVEQLVKTYKETGEYPTLSMKRRPKTHLTDEQKRII